MFASNSSLIIVGLIVVAFLLTSPKRVPLEKTPLKLMAKGLFSFWMVFGVAQLLLHSRTVDQPVLNLFYQAFMIGLIAVAGFSYAKFAKHMQVDRVARFISMSIYALIAVFGTLFAIFASTATAWVFGGVAAMWVINIVSAITAWYLFTKERNFVPEPEPNYPDIPLMTRFEKFNLNT